MSVETRVAKGIQWLKANRNIDQINIETVDVEDIEFCPLGQTGGYFATLQELFPFKSEDVQHALVQEIRAEQWAIEYGFASTTFTDYDELSGEWRKQLKANKM